MRTLLSLFAAGALAFGVSGCGTSTYDDGYSYDGYGYYGPQYAPPYAFRDFDGDGFVDARDRFPRDSFRH